MHPAVFVGVIATLSASFVANNASAACVSPPQMGRVIDVSVGDIRSAKLVEQTIVDNRLQSTVRQKFVLTTNAIPTEPKLQKLMAQLFEQANRACRKHSLEGVTIFVYRPSADTTGSLWVARLDTQQMTPAITIRHDLIAKKESNGEAACIPGEEPGKSLNWQDEVALPPLSKRRVIGTWEVWPEVAMSLEEVRGKTYSVLRTKYCESGSKGKLLKRSERKYIETSGKDGKYYVILPSGDLAAYDREGYIESYEKQVSVWARK